MRLLLSISKSQHIPSSIRRPFPDCLMIHALHKTTNYSQARIHLLLAFSMYKSTVLFSFTYLQPQLGFLMFRAAHVTTINAWRGFSLPLFVLLYPIPKNSFTNLQSLSRFPMFHRYHAKHFNIQIQKSPWFTLHVLARVSHVSHHLFSHHQYNNHSPICRSSLAFISCLW